MAVQTLSLPSSGRSTAATGPTLSMSGGPGVPYTGPVATTTPYVAPAQPAPAAAVTTTEVQYDDMGNPIDNGIADAARNINEAFPQGMPNYLSGNYRPARSVGTGVAVAQPSYLQEMGTLPGVAARGGQDLRMTGGDIARALSSYDPNSIGYKLAAGYRQLFGREIDPTGAEFYLRNLQTVNDPNQPIGARSSQAEINRYLLGGAQGGDLEAARDYQLSLTGGRPPVSQGQFFQPVYRPESYYNYRQIPFRSTVGASPMAGFNPFAFTNAPSVQSQYTGYRPFSGMMNPYSRMVGQGVATAMPAMGRMPFRAQQPLAAGGRIEDGIRSVRYR